MSRGQLKKIKQCAFGTQKGLFVYYFLQFTNSENGTAIAPLS